MGKCGVIVSSKFSSKQVSMNDECDKVTMFATIVSIEFGQFYIVHR